MNIGKILICVLLFCYSEILFGQDALQEIEIEEAFADSQSKTGLTEDNSSAVPFSKLFYKFGSNAFHSLTYNYGFNYVAAGAGTYALVQSGADWQWNRMAAKNKWIAYSGIPSGLAGGIVPIVAPLGLYFYGRKHDNAKSLSLIMCHL